MVSRRALLDPATADASPCDGLDRVACRPIVTRASHPAEPHAEFVQRPLSTQLDDLAQAAAEPRDFEHDSHDDVQYQQDDDLELEQGETLFETCPRLIRQLFELEPGRRKSSRILVVDGVRGMMRRSVRQP